MDEARARRLQPYYMRAFFLAAFKLLNGSIAERESGRYEIRHVPADVRDRDRQRQDSVLVRLTVTEGSRTQL